MADSPTPAFAVWVTGLPASGKSTIVTSLKAQLAARRIDAAVLESDALRPVFAPHPQYDETARAGFYRQMAWIGELLVRHGVPVIFDGTANRRAWRDSARSAIPRFIEAYVNTPLEVCMARDPKGIYRSGRDGSSEHVPGLQTPYEPPQAAELVLSGDKEPPELAARRIIALLERKRYIAAPS